MAAGERARTPRRRRARAQTATSASIGRGYRSKSSGRSNWSGLTKIDTTVTSAIVLAWLDQLDVATVERPHRRARGRWCVPARCWPHATTPSSPTGCDDDGADGRRVHAAPSSTGRGRSSSAVRRSMVALSTAWVHAAANVSAAAASSRLSAPFRDPGNPESGLGAGELDVAGRQPEDRVAVEHRVRGPNGAGHAVVGDRSELADLGLGQRGRRGHDADRGVQAAAACRAARRAARERAPRALGSRRPAGAMSPLGSQGSPVDGSTIEPLALTTASAPTITVDRAGLTIDAGEAGPSVLAVPTPPCSPPALAPGAGADRCPSGADRRGHRRRRARPNVGVGTVAEVAAASEIEDHRRRHDGHHVWRGRHRRARSGNPSARASSHVITPSAAASP